MYDGWCGNRGMYVLSKWGTSSEGSRWYGLAGEQPILVRSTYVGLPVACSFDGEWLVYMDPDGHPHRGSNYLALRRFHVRTRRDERFAVVAELPSNILAPSAHRVFIGPRPDVQITMPAPRWDVRWAPPDEPIVHPIWFPDSSGVWWSTYDEQQQWRVAIAIQRFDHRGRVTRLRPPLRHWMEETSLRPNEVVLRGDVSANNDDMFYRCVPSARQLKCTFHDIQTLPGMYGTLLPDGSVISVDQKTARTYRTLRNGNRYTVRIELRSSKYRYLELGAVSPDGRKVMVRGSNEGLPGLNPYEVAMGHVALDALK